MFIAWGLLVLVLGPDVHVKAADGQVQEKSAVVQTEKLTGQIPPPPSLLELATNSDYIVIGEVRGLVADTNSARIKVTLQVLETFKGSVVPGKYLDFESSFHDGVYSVNSFRSHAKITTFASNEVCGVFLRNRARQVRWADFGFSSLKEDMQITILWDDPSQAAAGVVPFESVPIQLTCATVGKLEVDFRKSAYRRCAMANAEWKPLGELRDFFRSQRTVSTNDVSVSRILATPAQLGEGWSSNRLYALIEPLETPSERADPGEDPSWMQRARECVTRWHREAYAMARYEYQGQPCTVWVQRWTSTDYIPSNWGRAKDTKDSPALPKLGEEVRFSQRDGLHNNIDFIRGRYMISVESPSTRPEQVEPLKHLAEVLDGNLVKALGKVK